MTSFVHSQGYSWEYFIFGSGKEILFAFHGFDNEANDFKIFESEFGSRYKIIAINLFFHGQSDTPNHRAEDVFTTEILVALFSQILFDNSCERFSFLGFSLGGRIILDLIPHFAQRIDRVLLLAPDGLKISQWYLFITNTKIGNKIFKKVVFKPDNILRLSKLFYKIGIIGEKQYHFALSNFDTLEKRKKVYNVWMIFRSILPKAKNVGPYLSESSIPLDIYFGKKDTIIRESFGRDFIKKSGYKANIHILDAGHNLMKEKLVRELKPWLEDKKKVSV